MGLMGLMGLWITYYSTRLQANYAPGREHNLGDNPGREHNLGDNPGREHNLGCYMLSSGLQPKLFFF